MAEFFKHLFSSDGFMPHGHCYLWNPGVVWLHLVSDALIVLAYYSIPMMLVYFVHKRKDLEFHWMFHEVARALRPLAVNKGLQFEVTVPEAGLVVRTDRRALNQIILNLANNAIKFTERGRVHIRLRQGQSDGRPITEISVEDTGIGIRAEDQSKLFDPFSQADVPIRRGHEGTGLGLHLSRKLAELLGGQITFRSEFGKGSTFTLRLPAN